MVVVQLTLTFVGIGEHVTGRNVFTQQGTSSFDSFLVGKLSLELAQVYGDQTDRLSGPTHQATLGFITGALLW